MTRSIRKLFASALLGSACLVPSLPAFAEDKPAAIAVPADKKMTARQLHDHLAKGSGWVRFKTETGTNNGTAWILDKDKKLMITNAHVVDGKDVVQVIFPEWKDGKLVREESAYDKVAGVKATVIDRDESRDLALLLLESIPETSHVLKVADAEPEEGDNVRTIGGFTLGGEGLVWGAVRGEVRTVGPVIGWRGNAKVRKVSTDAPINGGNSGGPLVNEVGEVVGVNASYQTNARNVSHHISIDELKGFMKVAGPLVKPETAEQFLLRGQRRLDYYRNDVAVQDFSAAIKKNDKLADAYHLRGKAFLRKGDATTALEDLNTAMMLDKGVYDYHVTRGKCYIALKKNDEAQLDFSAAIRIDPSQAFAYNERGVGHYRANKFDDALADFTRAIDKGNPIPLYYANRADTFNALGKYEACVKDWASASELAPWDSEYAVNLGWAAITAGKHETSLQAFSLAVKIDPSARHLVLQGIGQRLTGDMKGALKSVNDGLAKYGDSNKSGELYTAYYNRGMIQSALKNHKQAIEDLNKAVELTEGKNYYAFVERAKANLAAGNEDAANTDFATAKKLGWKSNTAEAAAPGTALLGTWKGSFDTKLGKITQELTFFNDGSWSGTTTIVGDNGTEIVKDTGTYKYGNGELSFKGNITGNVTRKINKMDGKKMEVELKEVETTATFTKVK